MLIRYGCDDESSILGNVDRLGNLNGFLIVYFEGDFAMFAGIGECDGVYNLIFKRNLGVTFNDERQLVQSVFGLNAVGDNFNAVDGGT